MLRQAAEKNVLTYLIALGYDQKPRQLVLERGLKFTPLPPDVIDGSDPAKFSNVLCIDFDNLDVSPLNGNYLATMSGKYLYLSLSFFRQLLTATIRKKE